MMRRTWFAFGAVAALLAAPRVVADSVIDTTGATLTPGAALHPGQVVVDANAFASQAPVVPRADVVESIGWFAEDLPRNKRAFHGGEPFFAAASKSLPGGVYEYSTYLVAPGVNVTYDGPTTICVAGDVVVDGRVATTRPKYQPNSGGLTFEAGGRTMLGATATIEADDVQFDVTGPFTASAGATITAYGVVTIRTRGTDAAPSDVHLDGVHVSLRGFVVQASGAVTLSGKMSVHSFSGPGTVQAFGGDVTLSGGTGLTANPSGEPMRLEAAGAVRIEGGYVSSFGLDLRIRAFGGGVSVTDGAQIFAYGADIRATGPIDLGEDALESGANVRVQSAESDVVLRAGPIFSANPPVYGNGVDLMAGRDVVVFGTGGDAVYSSGAVRVTAGRDVVTDGATRWRCGDLALLSRRSIAAPGLHVSASSAVFGAETGSIALADMDYLGPTGGGGFRAVAFGPLSVGGSIRSQGAIELASRTADVNVAGASLATSAAASPNPYESPAVAVESFAGPTGRIAAPGVQIATGTAQNRSGDVRVVVHAAEVVEPSEGFVVIEHATARKTRGGKTVLAASGRLDFGSTPLNGADATLTIGDVPIPVPLSLAGRSGLRVKGDGFRLELRPDAPGASRATFRLMRTGGVSGFLAADGSGDVTIRLAAGAASASGTVRLVKGAYHLGRAKASPRAPAMSVIQLDGRLPGARPGTLDVTIGLGPDVAAVAAATNVRVSVGDRFSVTMPRSAFVERTPGVLRAVAPAPGVRLATIDLREGTMRVVAMDADLRTTNESAPTQLVVGAAIDALERRVLVRVRTVGERIVY